MRLDALVCKKLDISKSKAQKLIMSEKIKLDGKICTKCATPTNESSKIEAIPTDQPIISPISWPLNLTLLHENSDFLILNKPPKLLTHGISENDTRENLSSIIKAHFDIQDDGDAHRSGVVHRLDYETSGAIIIAKNNASKAKLQELIRERKIGRYYLAIINEPLKQSVQITSLLGRDKNNPRRFKSFKNQINNLDSEDIFTQNDPKYRVAKSAFIPLLDSKNSSYQLICAKLFTGRTHQIRVHLKALNRFIIGDMLYAPKSYIKTQKNSAATSDLRMFLHAALLSLPNCFWNYEFGGRICAPLFADMLKFANTYFDELALNSLFGELCDLPERF
ncbi:MAG: RluA family pseudouridine synthase [Helicobacter sp.]|nr:RluA family pseudouridine synthase [Helicobacter sp.]